MLKTLLKIVLVLFLILLLCVGCDNASLPDETSDPGSSEIKETTEKATDSDMPEESNTETQQNAIETEEQKVFELIDFIVNVPEDREPVILHLTDMQIIDASQSRTPDRLGSTHMEYWHPDNKDERCYDYLREIIQNTSPDLILITGDLVYGEFDDNGENLLELIDFMEGFEIPWAPVFGNHDNQGGPEYIEGIVDNYSKLSNFVYESGDKAMGNGNYVILVKEEGEKGKPVTAFVMMDTHNKEPYIDFQISF